MAKGCGQADTVHDADLRTILQNIASIVLWGLWGFRNSRLILGAYKVRFSAFFGGLEPRLGLTSNNRSLGAVPPWSTCSVHRPLPFGTSYGPC